MGASPGLAPSPLGKYGMIGLSSQMFDVYNLIDAFGPTDANILIYGESGTGKELIAHALHNRHPLRYDHPLITLNCATIPEALFESELFGYERGAFTGAMKNRLGAVQHAHHGTLFLDEIGDLHLTSQAKMLRTIERKEATQLGKGGLTVKVDARIISATNNNLEKNVSEGIFRSDLYHRINTLMIYSPALRERREDIPLLAEHFADHFSTKYNKRTAFDANTIAYLGEQQWPGNVRQLNNVIERAVVLSASNVIQRNDMERIMRMGQQHSRTYAQARLEVSSISAVSRHQATDEFREIVERLRYSSTWEEINSSLIDMRAHVLMQKVNENQGSITRTAEKLRMDRKSISKLIKKSQSLSA